MLKKRINKLRKKLKKENIDVALFLLSEPIDDVNIRYFTEFCQERYNAFACLLVTQDKTTLIFTSLDYERAKGNEADEVLEKNGPLFKMLRPRIGNQTIGVVGGLFPYALSRKFRKIRDITGIVSEIRSIKEQAEIDAIKGACNITNKGIEFIRENIKEGIKENDIALGLEREMKRKGAEGMSFPTIVTSFKRSSQIHPFPSFSNQKIKRGLGLVDFGVIFKGYCSDVTFPFATGNLTEKEKKIARTVREAYEKSLEKLKNGVEAWKLFETAENVINKNGFELKHGLGHGIGLEVHDSPSISPRQKNTRVWKIRKNMVFTIEPGVYVKGIGGLRIENDFLMGDKNFEILTKSKFFKI